MKLRLDKLLVDRSFAASRERAQALILAGRVLVDEQRIDKPGTSVESVAVVRLLGKDLHYVSRGGLKLEAALKHWSINLNGCSCLDVGASTGGFTDCMLQHAAAHVLAIDTGYGQIHLTLRNDARVTLRERTNARLLSPAELTPNSVSFLAMDVSFISATLVLPSILGALSTVERRWTGTAIILVKPQFEAGREAVGNGGIVRSPEARQFAIDRVHQAVLHEGGRGTAIMDSPITGMEGNHEYLLYAVF